MVEDGSGRRTSGWSSGAELDRAARYLHEVRTAPGRVAQLRAAASVEGLAAVRSLLRALPPLPVAFSDSPIGEEMRAWFRPDRRLPVNRAPIAALQLPGTMAEYLRGRPRQALRTNLTRAAAEGLTCAPVTDVGELRRLAEHLAARRRVDLGFMVRTELVPRPDRWFTAAYDAAGDPIALNQTVVDGALAGLVLMVIEPGHPAAPLVRYPLHAAVVQRLVERGVTTLIAGGSMLLTSEGTRYFQQRTGWTPVWVTPLPSRHETATPSRPVIAPIGVRRREPVREAAPIG